MESRNHLPICNACGTQYDEQGSTRRTRCPICDDPRQFVPPSGQSWTSLAELRANFRNTFKQDAHDPRIWSIATEPKFGIGQRAILLETAHGNVLWDCISLLDQETVDFINSRGKGSSNSGLIAIIISHPHFNTTNGVWAEVFGCPVYTAAEDERWLFSGPNGAGSAVTKLISATETAIVPGVTAVKCGGHFPGSLCLHWADARALLTSDTVVTVPSSHNPDEHRLPGGETVSYAFMWAIPNMIPLDPRTIAQIWERLLPFDFEATFGNIPGMDVRHPEVKKRLLQSAKVQVKRMGWEGREEGERILRAKWPPS